VTPEEYERFATSWIDRVREADAAAEDWFRDIVEQFDHDKRDEVLLPLTLIAIAAELRAARIARRPGAGQT
jgi:hypothetical protein